MLLVYFYHFICILLLPSEPFHYLDIELRDSYLLDPFGVTQ